LDAHALIVKKGFHEDIVVGIALINSYVKSGHIGGAHRQFDKRPKRNAFSYTTMVAGYAQHGNFEDACYVFDRMPERNVVSWTAMITGYAQNGKIEATEELFEKMPEHSVVSCNAMIAAYFQNRRIDSARKIFNRMPEQDVFSWAAMICRVCSTWSRGGGFESLYPNATSRCEAKTIHLHKCSQRMCQLGSFETGQANTSS